MSTDALWSERTQLRNKVRELQDQLTARRERFDADTKTTMKWDAYRRIADEWKSDRAEIVSELAETQGRLSELNDLLKGVNFKADEDTADALLSAIVGLLERRGWRIIPPSDELGNWDGA